MTAAARSEEPSVGPCPAPGLYTPGAMAQPKPKKKRRSRSDPARREAAERREAARRAAAEERRREHEAAERRKKLRKTARRLAMPVLVGLGVVVAAVFLFRPQRELPEVDRIDTTAIVTGLGYLLPTDVDQNLDLLPDPACGTAEGLSAEQFYADLYHGVVVLFHQPTDTATAAALASLAADYDSHVVVAPNDRISQSVLAVSWDRRKGYGSAADAREFADTYRKRGPAEADCPLPGD